MMLTSTVLVMLLSHRPPERYRHPYHDGPTVKYSLPIPEIQKACRKPDQKPGFIYGCQFFVGTTSFMIIPEYGGLLSDNVVKLIEEHELAHANGYRHDENNEETIP